MALKEVKLNILKKTAVSDGGIQLVGVEQDGTEVFIPADEPTNRHYVEAKEWYDSQKKKPFKYEF